VIYTPGEFRGSRRAEEQKSRKVVTNSKVVPSEERGYCSNMRSRTARARRVGALLPFLFLLSGCPEYGLHGDEPDPPPKGNDAVDTGLPWVEGPREEWCNGIDDDGDGLIDEGFPDDDGNGRVDCLDVSCPELEAPVGGPVECVDSCPLTPIEDAWSTRVKWQVLSPSEEIQATDAIVTPVVGHLDDDDGDGQIGSGDIPDVVINIWGKTSHPDTPEGGWIVALDGAEGAEKWAWGPRVNLSSGSVIADVDLDGYPEIISSGPDYLISAISFDGIVEWQNPDMYPGDKYLVVGDLDGNGTVELVAEDMILDGATGATLSWLDVGYDNGVMRFQTIGDIDQDGDQEILVAGKVFDSDGTLLYDTGETGPWLVQPALVQADGDLEAEIVWIGEDLTVWDADGTLRVRVDMDGWMPGPPCAGDLDGDGQMEIAWADSMVMYAYELDGTPMWTAMVDDSSGVAGCSAWDLDADGSLEVVFAGERTLYVLDGSTGVERITWAGHRSWTMREVPAIADVDADGHGEIVISGMGTEGGAALTVLEHDGPGWGPAGLWRSWDSSMTNLPDDGTVPATPTAPWIGPGVFRGRPTGSAADLRVDITDACVADCDYGPAAIAVQVSNAGTVSAREGARVVVYAVDAEERRELASTTLPDIPAGTSLDSIVFDIGYEDIGSDGFEVVVDSEDSVHECDEENNEASWNEVTCP